MSLCMTERGEGEAVVLIHGLGASALAFSRVLAAGERRAHFFLPELPCHGRSSGYADATPAAIAEALAAELRARGVGPLAVFGHSFGGLVALELAARLREQVRVLAVASAPSLGLPLEARLLLANPLLDVAAAWAFPVVTQRPLLRHYLAWLMGREECLDDELVEQYAAASRAPGFTAALLEASRAVARYELPLAALDGADFPRRVLWGARDPLVPVAHARALARQLDAELLLLPDVGHCLAEEAPDVLLASVLGRRLISAA